uniref:Uncharacterized protein n=1 Tax=Acrobeloides nanus TaxID=290746 RepID=A0A914E5R2_9BILA
MSSKIEEHEMKANESSNNNPEPSVTLFDPRFAKRNFKRTKFEGKNPWKKILKEVIKADDDGKRELIVRKNPWKKILKEVIKADDDGKRELIVSKHDVPWRICIILFSEVTVLLQIIIGSFVVGMNMKRHVLYISLAIFLVQSLVTAMSLMIYYHHQSKVCIGLFSISLFSTLSAQFLYSVPIASAHINSDYHSMFPAVINVILLLVVISYAFHKTKESPSPRMTKIVTPQLKAISYTKWIKKISDVHIAHTRMKNEANEKVSPISNKTA